jgi:hypothetical protein
VSGTGIGSLFALSFFEREKKDFPPLDWRVFLSFDENIAAVGRVSQRRFALAPCRRGWPIASLLPSSLALVTSSSCLQHPACSRPNAPY